MKKRVVSLLLTGVLALSMLAGCGNKNVDSKETAGTTDDVVEDVDKETVDDEDASAGDKEVIKWTVTADTTGFYVEQAARFEEQNPEYTVEITEVPNGTDMYAKLTMMMTSAETAPDVIAEDGFMVMSDAAAGYLEPLDEFMSSWEDTAQYDEALLTGGKGADGVQYAIPSSTDVQCIWYNMKLFEEAGITVPFEPKTWDDVIAAGKALKETFGADDFIPMFLHASATAQEETSMRTFQVLYFGTGGELYDFDQSKWIVDKENLLKTFNFVNDVYNVEQLGAPLSIVSQSKVDDLIVSDLIKNDKVGMYFSGSWIPSNWVEGGSYEWPEAYETIGVAKMPTYDGDGYTTMSGGWTWAIPANANNKEGGKKLLAFLCSKDEQLAKNQNFGEMTVRKDAAEDPKYTELPELYMAETAEFLPYTHFRPSVEGYAQLTVMFTEVTESITLGTTPEEAVANFESEMQRIAGEENVIVK